MLKPKKNLICNEDFYGSLWHHDWQRDPNYWKNCDFTVFDETNMTHEKIWCPYEEARKTVQGRE